MASRQPMTEARRPSPRLYLVAPPVDDPAALARSLADALRDGDAAAVLARLPHGDESFLINYAKMLAGPVQDGGAALLIDHHPDIVARIGADGTHARDAGTLSSAFALLKPEGIVGAGELHSRDDAMRAGEAGADYVMFGEPDRADQRPSFDAIVERVAWWAELFVVPCVAYAAHLDEIGPLSAAGADFIAVESLVWSDARGPHAAIRSLTSRLRVRETAE
jgi:thiamine-phosphate pyrophosphorylase